MSYDAIGIVVGIGFIAYVFWFGLEQELRKATKQRSALYEQLNRIAAKLDHLPSSIKGDSER